MTHKEMVQRLTEAVGLSESPVAVYYSDEKPEGAFEWNGQGFHFCVIMRLAAVRKGTPLAVNGENPGCAGSAFYLGYFSGSREGFRYFISHGEDGKGERYIKTPELVDEWLAAREFVPANGKYCIFQRLEDVPEEITPEAVAMFAPPDELSGLSFLASYDRGADRPAIISPFSAGCGYIVAEPRAQAKEAKPKAILGLFDPSARPYVDKNHLSFAVPYNRFVEMVENVPGSFLEIEPYTKIKGR